MLNRRGFIASGGIVVFGSALIEIKPAAALNLGKVFKGVATTIVQGIHVATKPVEQLVKTGTDILESTVREAGHAADATLQMINKVQQQTAGAIDQANQFAQQGIAQVLPLFANAGFQAQQLDFVLTQAGKLLSLGSSSEDELRSDPYGFVDRNSQMLLDHVNTFPQQIGTTTISAGAGQFGIGQVRGGQAPGKGYYASVLSLSDIIRLVTLLAAL